ncbi:hypothetical protein ACFQ1Q_05765 [Winogradskyella litorisediminis]|uniref:DUF2219 family protein n=1 Tax=Winogradskyella litorisediminis TaxID=1156618 RepID=A0ABW3N5J9_9FLAO
MKLHNIIIICVLISFNLNAQEKKNPSFALNFGQSSQNTFTKAKPAQLIATFPANDTIANSFLINGFVEGALNWERDDKFSYSIGIAYEVQKNTLISNEQDVKQFGLTASQIITNDYEDSKGQYILSQNLKISENFITDKKALQAHLGFKYEDFRSNSLFYVDAPIPLIGTKSAPDQLLSFRWDYDLGLGYIGGDEEVLFGKASFSVSAFPFYGLLKKAFKQPEIIFVTYKLDSRAPFIGDTDLDINPLRSLSTGLSYVINDTNKLLLAYTWNKGANPFSGLINQEYSTLTVQFKINLKN